MNIQHKLGQHYSKEEELVSNYKKTLLNNAYKTIVDPFVGEGHLLFFYLGLFSTEKQLEIIKSKRVMGFDLYEDNIKNIKQKFKEMYGIKDELADELFKVRDSLLDNSLPDNAFVFTNPPYLAKNVCKKSYPDDFARYFESLYKDQNDYFEIAMSNYTNCDGVWIVPANLLSSDIMNRLRKKVIFNMEEIYVYQKKIFEDTDITVCTFTINKSVSTVKKEIIFVGDTQEHFKFEISKSGNLCKEWDDIKLVKNDMGVEHGYMDSKIEVGNQVVCLLDVDYKEREFEVSLADKKRLESSCLVLRTTDTGTKAGKIGLYTIEEIWKNKKAKGLVTKISSRVYTQIFFKDMSIEEQKTFAKKFNAKLNGMRDKYKSIFLTNYKNSSNGEQRKRLSFKEAFSLMNVIREK